MSNEDSGISFIKCDEVQIKNCTGSGFRIDMRPGFRKHWWQFWRKPGPVFKDNIFLSSASDGSDG
jgi:hypothetical protein